MAKIIPFPESSVKYLFVHLTSEMMKGLLAASSKEKNNLHFRRSDLPGPFTALYRSGLISVRNISENGKNKNIWFLTTLGKKALDTNGFKG